MKLNFVNLSRELVPARNYCFDIVPGLVFVPNCYLYNISVIGFLRICLHPISKNRATDIVEESCSMVFELVGCSFLLLKHVSSTVLTRLAHSVIYFCLFTALGMSQLGGLDVVI